MTAVLNVLANGVGVLDTSIATGYQGVGYNTAGEGAAARLQVIEDYVNLTTTFLGATHNYARLVRIPSRAKIKRVEIWNDKILDTNATSTLAFDVGVAFSDYYTQTGMYDGVPASYSGSIPTTAGNAVTPFSSYSSPNILFGNVAQGNNTYIQGATVSSRKDVTFNGTLTNYSEASILQQPLVSLFGFKDGRGAVIEELGWMDIYIYLTAVAATAQAGNLFCSVQFTGE